MLKPEVTVLIILDVQGRLAHMMYEDESLVENLQKMIKGAQVLEIPIIWLEQLPNKLGPTIPEISELLVGIDPINKDTFSACGNETFIESLKALNAEQVLVVGIEAHICVYQTVMGLIGLNYKVEVVEDAVSSRTSQNKQLALRKMSLAGAGMTSVEMALFELLEIAEGAQFKSVLKIVK